MPYADVSDFVVQLRERDSVDALTMQFLILTAARSSEVLTARWSESRRKGVDGPRRSHEGQARTSRPSE